MVEALCPVKRSNKILCMLLNIFVLTAVHTRYNRKLLCIMTRQRTIVRRLRDKGNVEAENCVSLLYCIIINGSKPFPPTGRAQASKYFILLVECSCNRITHHFNGSKRNSDQFSNINHLVTMHHEGNRHKRREAAMSLFTDQHLVSSVAPVLAPPEVHEGSSAQGPRSRFPHRVLETGPNETATPRISSTPQRAVLLSPVRRGRTPHPSNILLPPISKHLVHRPWRWTANLTLDTGITASSCWTSGTAAPAQQSTLDPVVEYMRHEQLPSWKQPVLHFDRFLQPMSRVLRMAHCAITLRRPSTLCGTRRSSKRAEERLRPLRHVKITATLIMNCPLHTEGRTYYTLCATYIARAARYTPLPTHHGFCAC